MDIYVGTYAGEREEGILRFSLTGRCLKKTGGWPGFSRPSYLLADAERGVLYAVEELSPQGNVVACRLKNGTLDPVCRMPTGGANPCHLSEDDRKEFIFVANYTSGSLAVFRLGPDGIPLERTQLLCHEGHGPNPLRQEGPHIHFSQFLHESLWAVDLGLDKICRYTLDRQAGRLLHTGGDLLLPSGSGPRHFAVSPVRREFMYVLGELSNCVYVIDTTESCWPLQCLSLLPGDFSGSNKAAAIKISPDGRLLYASNRGHNSVAVFTIRSDGRLEPVCHRDSGGKSPRDIGLFDQCLLAANQDSDFLSLLPLDASGLPGSPAQISERIACPVCLCACP